MSMNMNTIKIMLNDRFRLVANGHVKRWIDDNTAVIEVGGWDALTPAHEVAVQHKGKYAINPWLGTDKQPLYEEI